MPTSAADVLELLGVLEAAGIDAWVDGGWGVDALLGEQTRPHEDLDLVVALEEVPRIRAAFGARGFEAGDDELPVRFVLVHPSRGAVDFHTVSFDAEGGGVQPQPGGGSFRYPPEGFVRGRIDGREVGCISPEVQLVCHLGYEPKAKDRHDVARLHERFGVPLPPAYRGGR